MGTGELWKRWRESHKGVHAFPVEWDKHDELDHWAQSGICAKLNTVRMNNYWRSSHLFYPIWVSSYLLKQQGERGINNSPTSCKFPEHRKWDSTMPTSPAHDWFQQSKAPFIVQITVVLVVSLGQNHIASTTMLWCSQRCSQFSCNICIVKNSFWFIATIFLFLFTRRVFLKKPKIIRWSLVSLIFWKFALSYWVFWSIDTFYFLSLDQFTQAS